MHTASQHMLYATSSTDSLTRWKHAIRLGNAAFDNGDCSQACTHYLQALELAASLFGRLACQHGAAGPVGQPQ